MVWREVTLCSTGSGSSASCGVRLIGMPSGQRKMAPDDWVGMKQHYDIRSDDEPAGIGVRQDDSVITKNLARFVPHCIEASGV